jgi:4-phosphopantoate--beta-alanine ligase
VVLVPLEDGDRAAALGEMGKTEIVIDLNPLSRSPQVAAVPVVDNVVRAVPNITRHARDLRDADEETLRSILADFDREATLRAAERTIRQGAAPPRD